MDPVGSVLFFALSLSVAVAQSPPVDARQTPILDVEFARGFGDTLLQQGDAAGAARWYALARHLGPTARELDPLVFRMGLAWEVNGEWSRAAEHYLQVDSPLRDRATLRAGICRFNAGAPNRGDDLLMKVEGAESGELAHAATMARGVLWLEEGQPDKAKAAFDGIPADHPMGATVAGLAARATTVDHQKHASLALALSVIPGMGQMYAGDKARAWNVLALSTLMGAGSYGMMSWGMQQQDLAAMGVGVGMGVGGLATMVASA